MIHNKHKHACSQIYYDKRMEGPAKGKEKGTPVNLRICKVFTRLYVVASKRGARVLLIVVVLSG